MYRYILRPFLLACLSARLSKISADTVIDFLTGNTLLMSLLNDWENESKRSAKT